MSLDTVVENKAKGYAYRLLKCRNRSEKEIREKFLKRKFSSCVIESVIKYLKAASYIDDARFAREWVDFRLRVPFGFKRIIFELKQKGIKEEIINAVVKSEHRSIQESQALLDIAKRKFRVLAKREKGKIKIRQKVYSFLFRRGFSSADIIEVLGKIIPL